MEKLKEQLIKQAEILISQARWTKTTSKKYENNPHEWVLNYRAKELFSILKRLLEGYGYTEYFYRTPFKYIDIGNYKYWVYENIINRAILDGISKDTRTVTGRDNLKSGKNKLLNEYGI